MADQLVIWMALGAGDSAFRCSEPSLHARTAMVVAEALLPGVKFRVTRPHGGGKGAGGGGHGGPGAEEGAEGRSVEVVEAAEGEDGLWLVECRGAGWTVGRRA
jgi:RNA 3'-terminal phosphate cyclase (ATP)